MDSAGKYSLEYCAAATAAGARGPGRSYCTNKTDSIVEIIIGNRLVIPYVRRRARPFDYYCFRFVLFYFFHFHYCLVPTAAAHTHSAVLFHSRGGNLGESVGRRRPVRNIVFRAVLAAVVDIMTSYYHTVISRVNTRCA